MRLRFEHVAFDPAQFRKDLVYRARVAPAEILRDIKRIRQQDRIAESRRSKSGWIGGLALVCAFLGFLFTFAILDVSDGGIGIALVAVGALAVTGAAALVYRGTQGKFDYEDRRYVLLERILPLIEADLATGAPIDVRMDLAKPTVASKSNGGAEIRGWKVKFFEDPWLSMSGQFVDGTRFFLEATEKFQKRSKWKQSSSGKMKHKTKTKSATQLSLHLAVKPKRYPALERVHAQADGALQLPKKVMVKRVDTAADSLGLRVLIKSEWDCPPPGEASAAIDGRELVASMFLSLYQVLNLAKAVAKGRPRVV